MDDRRPVPVPPLQPLHPLRGRALSESEVQDMSSEKFIFGCLWAGCRTRLGLMHQAMVVEKVSWKLRLHFSFMFFDKKCFGVHSLESIPAFWSAGLVSWVWWEVSKSWASAQGLGIHRGERTARLASWELKGLRKYSEQMEVFKDFPPVKFSIRWGVLEEHLTLFLYGLFLIIAHSAAPALCFLN